MILRPLFRILISLRLTVICLGFAIILVFIGTLAQVHLGINTVQEKYFNVFLVWWKSPDGNLKIPMLPGGYLLGTILFFNLLAAHFFRFKWTWKKSGIFLTHIGVLLLLLGGFLSSIFSVESQMPLGVGQTKSFSENPREVELAVMNITDPHFDEVVAIPEGILARQKSIQNPHLPFRLNILKYFQNSQLTMKKGGMDSSEPTATRDVGRNIQAVEIPRETAPDHQDTVSAWVEVVTPKGSLGIWLLSNGLGKIQTFTEEGKTWRLAIRQKRYYQPWSLQLVKFSHDLYPGTDIPKNFSSLVHLANPLRNEDREVLIYMNHPLRYLGETYYQASFADNDKTSILQVMKNPTWITPYLACSLVALGLLLQFSIHLTGFLNRRRTPA